MSEPEIDDVSDYISDYLRSKGFTYAGPCPECGGTLVKHTDPIVDYITERTFCTNYGGCENAPG